MKAVLNRWRGPIRDRPLRRRAGRQPKASAYLLVAYAVWSGRDRFSALSIPVSARRPAVIVEADARWYVGPGNGLFELIARRAETVRHWEITWTPEVLGELSRPRPLLPSPPCWRAASRHLAGPASTRLIAGQIGRTTSVRSSTSIILAMPSPG